MPSWGSNPHFSARTLLSPLVAEGFLLLLKALIRGLGAKILNKVPFSGLNISEKRVFL
jgi:hypothetical protein